MTDRPFRRPIIQTPLPAAIHEAVDALAARVQMSIAASVDRPGASAKPAAETSSAASRAALPGVTAILVGGTARVRLTAAAVLAVRLGRPLEAIDLSDPANRYIGETEKNIDALFARASAAGALLFFDEADALFGKRTDVKDSHDRYADIETSYLPRRAERHRCIFILGIANAAAVRTLSSAHVIDLGAGDPD
jgi:hypothetical protein